MGIEHLDFETMDEALREEARERFSIRGMEVGESGWAVPWAVDVDTKGRLWLKPEYSIQPERDGLSAMLVERRDHGYVINFSYIPPAEMDEPYKIPSELVENMSEDNPNWLPVIELIP
ncbi:hypothetical protein KW789_01210 [Candidatus Saccharibacteria bacterium]|jgi:hypothetical protein|nr:hypothetical protein [Candidatus Saccharibacteria bacterium]